MKCKSLSPPRNARRPWGLAGSRDRLVSCPTRQGDYTIHLHPVHFAPRLYIKQPPNHLSWVYFAPRL